MAGDAGDRIGTTSASPHWWTARRCGLEALERDVSILFPGAARGDPAPRGLAAAGDRLGRAAPRSCASSTAPDCEQFFGAIVAAEDTPVSKPAPDPYLRAVERAVGRERPRLVPAECVAIEDSHWGLESARAAGLRTVAVTHTYPASALGAADLLIDHLDRLTMAGLRGIDPPPRRPSPSDELDRAVRHICQEVCT